MAVTSWFTCGTCVDETSVGTIAWVSNDLATPLVGNECSSDNNVYAGVLAASLSTTHYLKCTNFGLTSSDVPSGSTIDGIEIEVIQFRNNVPLVLSTTVRYAKGGTISGNDIGVAGDWALSETATTYGGASQLGGLSWTQSDAVASNFGMALSVSFEATRIAPSSRSTLVEQVRMRVYYTAPIINSYTIGIQSITGISSITF